MYFDALCCITLFVKKVIFMPIVFIDEAKYYVKIFTEVGRLEQIQTYYTNCHKVNSTIGETDPVIYVLDGFHLNINLIEFLLREVFTF